MVLDPAAGAPLPCSIARWLSVRNGAQAVDFYKSDGADFWLGDESPEHGNFSPESLGGGTVRMAGRNRSTRRRAAETHATRSCFHNHGPIWQCFGPSQAQGQSANRATRLEKGCQPTGLHSIKKRNCGAVPLIGQFWTVAASAQLLVTL